MNNLKKISNTMSMVRNFFYWKELVIGLGAGIICGLFASGGGMILVPAFIYLLNMKEVEARATSILCILPMVVISGIFYYQNHYINIKSGILCAIGGIIGGIIGAKLLNKIPEKYIKITFTTFLIYASFKMIVS